MEEIEEDENTEGTEVFIGWTVEWSVLKLLRNSDSFLPAFPMSMVILCYILLIFYLHSIKD